MKIVCDNCATKYSIADEKVRGKVFKIRCKKCSHIIVVRGNDGANVPQQLDGGGDFPGGDEPATSISPGGAAPSLGGGASDAVWHLVVDREQIGPLTAQEVRGKFAAGEIDAETYSWREGFADWLRLGSIDDFRDLGAGSGAPSDEGSTRRTDSADLFSSSNNNEDSSNDAGSDLFGNAGAAAPAPAAAFSAGGGSGGLFGAPDEAPAPAPSRPSRNSQPSFSQQAGGAQTESASDGPRPMTGQRNENSVLFSLNNLQALASGGGGGGAAPSQAKSSGDNQRPGFASSQTEGSGLIDIRAMAASTLAAGPSGPSSNKGDDGPGFSSAPIFSPMAAPILMPSAPSGPPKWMWAILGVGVLAVLGIVVVGILLLTRKPEVAPLVAVAPAPVAAPVAAPLPTAAPTAAGEKPATPAPGETAKPATDEPKAHHAAAPAGGAKHEKPARHEKGGASPEASSAAATPAPSEAPPASTPHKGKKDALDDLLNNAAPDSKPARHVAAAAPEESAGGGDVKDSLDKGDIVGGMSKVKGKVAGCYDQFKVPGLANVSVTIAGSGHVSSATVSGAFSGTPTGSCVEKAVKGASFPKSKNSQTINYPFMLR